MVGIGRESERPVPRSACGSPAEDNPNLFGEFSNFFFINQWAGWEVIGRTGRRAGIIDGALILDYSVRTFGETLNW